jgi:hypothetical protein
MEKASPVQTARESSRSTLKTTGVSKTLQHYNIMYLDPTLLSILHCCLFVQVRGRSWH